MGDFLKALLIGVPVMLATLVVGVLLVWGFFAALINFPKTTILGGLLVFSVFLGYSILEAARG